MNDPAITPSATAAVVPPREISLERWRELQRLAELGRLSASLLHEISNPLTAASLHLERGDQLQPHHLKHVRRNLQLLQRYVEAARQQVRQESPAARFFVRPEVEQVKRVVAPYARRAGVRLQVEIGANYRLWGDAVKFQQIIANLVVNAVDAYNGAPGVGLPVVSVRLTGRQQWLCLQVQDAGIGMTAEQLNYIYEPFYTTKSDTGHDLGIGLTAVKRYVEQDFGGSVAVRSRPGHGTCFKVKLRLTSRYDQAGSD